MARRKPKGILDNIADYAKSVTDIWKEGPKDTVQLAKAKQATRNVVETGATATDAYLTAGLGGSFARNVAIPGSMVASPATKARAVDAGLARFARDAAIVGASAGVIRGTAAGVQAVQAGRVVNPAAAASNVIRGQRVIVHGSRTENIKQLLPNAGSRALPEERVLFGFDPRKTQAYVATSKANTYATQQASSKGSIYVAKVPKRGTKTLRDTDHKLAKNTKFESVVAVSKKPGKVLKEIPSYDVDDATGAQYLETYRALQRSLRRAGVVPRKTASADKLVPTIKRLVRPKPPRKFYPAP